MRLIGGVVKTREEEEILTRKWRRCRESFNLEKPRFYDAVLSGQALVRRKKVPVLLSKNDHISLGMNFRGSAFLAGLGVRGKEFTIQRNGVFRGFILLRRHTFASSLRLGE